LDLLWHVTKGCRAIAGGQCLGSAGGLLRPGWGGQFATFC